MSLPPSAAPDKAPDPAEATQPAGPPADAHAHAKPAEGWAETIKTVLYAVLIAFGVRTLAYEPFNIPSGSMIPTLLIGDYLFVSKLSYGYSKYTVGLGLPLFDGRLFYKEPERGDVVVFKLPLDNKTDYIKRVVGLPGDTIQVRGGILQINGKPVERERIADYVTHDQEGREAHIAQYIETLPNGRKHKIIELSDSGPLDNTPLFKVPANHFFMMGDNRDNSSDSRVSPLEHGVGYVPVENLVGRAEVLFFSLDRGTRFYELWRWPFDLRVSRLLEGVR